MSLITPLLTALAAQSPSVSLSEKLMSHMNPEPQNASSPHPPSVAGIICTMARLTSKQQSGPPASWLRATTAPHSLPFLYWACFLPLGLSVRQARERSDIKEQSRGQKPLPLGSSPARPAGRESRNFNTTNKTQTAHRGGARFPKDISKQPRILLTWGQNVRASSLTVLTLPSYR